jgi:hypothetical protein
MRLTSFFRLLMNHTTDLSRSCIKGSMLLGIAAALLSQLATAAIIIATLVCLTCVARHASTPDLDSPPGSEVIIRTEVTAIWVPQALRDLARRQADPPADRSPEKVRTYLAGSGWREPWYAVTSQVYQRHGRSGETTHIRWLTEIADRPDELQAVMATAAGRPPRYEDGRFSRTRVHVIPDTLQAVDSRTEIIRLMAELVEGSKSSPPGGLDFKTPGGTCSILETRITKTRIR